MKYLINKLKPEDYYKCSNIWNMEKDPAMTQKWYDEIVSGNRIVFIYTQNDEFIGEGAMVFNNDDPEYTIDDQRIYLSRMIVKSEYQNQGIGGIILGFLINHAKYLGYNEISLGVNKDNKKARHLYEKKGFNTIIFDGEDEYGEYFKLLKKL